MNMKPTWDAVRNMCSKHGWTNSVTVRGGG